jgi:hypothetical protein
MIDIKSVGCRSTAGHKRGKRCQVSIFDKDRDTFELTPDQRDIDADPEGVTPVGWCSAYAGCLQYDVLTINHGIGKVFCISRADSPSL